MDRLDAMRVLLAVVDAGSLSAGSRKLNAPLPSVSRKVADLERYLGTNLIIRTSRNLQLTDAGRDYVEAARKIIADLEEVERRASGEYQMPRGLLTITMPIEFGHRYVLPIALDFMNKHPEVTLNVLSLDRSVHLVNEQVDVAIRLGELVDSSLYAVKAGEFRLLTCASPAYLERHGIPQHPTELADHDGIMFHKRSFFWSFEIGGKSVEVLPRSRIEVNTAANCVDAALNGVGIARLFRLPSSGGGVLGRARADIEGL